jgi:hypothetical protein
MHLALVYATHRVPHVLQKPSPHPGSISNTVKSRSLLSHENECGLTSAYPEEPPVEASLHGKRAVHVTGKLVADTTTKALSNERHVGFSRRIFI